MSFPSDRKAGLLIRRSPFRMEIRPRLLPGFRSKGQLPHQDKPRFPVGTDGEGHGTVKVPSAWRQVVRGVTVNAVDWAIAATGICNKVAIAISYLR